MASHQAVPRFDAIQILPSGAARVRHAFDVPRNWRPVRSTAEILAMMRAFRLLRVRLPLRLCSIFLVDQLLQLAHRDPQRGQVVFYDVPYSIRLDLRVSVDNDIPCANDLAPRNIGRQLSRMLA